MAIGQRQGVPGPPGPPGPSLGIVVPAGVDLGGHRAVCLDPTGAAVPASADDLGCVACIGITTGAAAQGTSVAVTRIGEVDDPSFAFTVGAVFLGLAGALTQAVPTSGLRLQIGFAIAPTRLLVHLRPPTILAGATE